MFLLVSVAAALCGAVVLGAKIMAEYAISVQYGNSVGAGS
jgi:hypothetical protein